MAYTPTALYAQCILLMNCMHGCQDNMTSVVNYHAVFGLWAIQNLNCRLLQAIPDFLLHMASVNYSCGEAIWNYTSSLSHTTHGPRPTKRLAPGNARMLPSHMTTLWRLTAYSVLLAITIFLLKHERYQLTMNKTCTPSAPAISKSLSR